MATKAEQDYLLAIYQISKNKGSARTSDIATVLKIRPPSVSDMLSKMQKKGLILYKPYEGARLSKEGEATARPLLSRQQIFRKFLKRILVPQNSLESDATVLERSLSPQAMRQLSKFVQFVDQFGENPCFFAHFKVYCQKGKAPDEIKKVRLICPTPKPK